MRRTWCLCCTLCKAKTEATECPDKSRHCARDSLNLCRDHRAIPLNPGNKRRREFNPPGRQQPPPQQAQSQLTRALLQMALRHESQLQAMATEDRFILFLQADKAGVLHLLLQETSKWKEAAQQRSTRTSLRQHLFMCLTQEMVTRLERVAQAQPTDPIWVRAIEQEWMWHFMQYDQQKKKLVATSQKPISMAKLRELIKELNELAQDSQQVLRFKCLKTPQKGKESPVYPWLLQLSHRPNLGAIGSPGSFECMATPSSSPPATPAQEYPNAWHGAYEEDPRTPSNQGMPSLGT